MENLPQDPIILLSYINTRLRDDYPEGLDRMCDDMEVNRTALEAKLGAAGFEYNPQSNRFV